MTLTTTYKSFPKRLLAESWATLFTITAVTLYSYFSSRDFARSMIFFSPVMVIWIVIGIRKAWHLVYEVNFTKTTIRIVGCTLDSRWEKEFDVKNATIEIRSKSKGRANVIYYLRIKSGNKSQDINRTFNWDYTALLAIFHEFKRIKDEEIIHDEKYYLGIMEQQSKGLSSGLFDIDWNLKKK
jgi:hypothetical protein